jgi:hypothetical protein
VMDGLTDSRPSFITSATVVMATPYRSTWRGVIDSRSPIRSL